MKVRLWGGPACGRIEQVEPYVENFRVMKNQPASAQQQILNTHNIEINVFEYHRTLYLDTGKIPVFMLPNAGEWLFQNWQSLVTEVFMREYRRAKFCIMPRVMWFELMRYVSQMCPTMWRANGYANSGARMFQDIEILDGDETRMLAERPRSPAFFSGYGQTRQIRGYSAQLIIDECSEWPAIESTPDDVAGMMVALMNAARDEVGVPEGIFRPDSMGASVRAGRPLPPLPQTREELAAMSDEDCRRLADGIRQGELAGQVGRTTNRIRRNRTTLAHGMILRVIIENGSNWEPERSAKLHRQYLNAVKNWHMQYVENGDRL